METEDRATFNWNNMPDEADLTNWLQAGVGIAAAVVAFVAVVAQILKYMRRA